MLNNLSLRAKPKHRCWTERGKKSSWKWNWTPFFIALCVFLFFFLLCKKKMLCSISRDASKCNNEKCMRLSYLPRIQWNCTRILKRSEWAPCVLKRKTNAFRLCRCKSSGTLLHSKYSYCFCVFLPWKAIFTSPTRAGVRDFWYGFQWIGFVFILRFIHGTSIIRALIVAHERNDGAMEKNDRKSWIEECFH